MGLLTKSTKKSVVRCVGALAAALIAAFVLMGCMNTFGSSPADANEASGPAALARAVSGTVIFSDDFESGNTSKWSISKGTWSVTTDGTRVLNQSSTSEARISSNAPVYSDGSVEARIKVTNFNGSNRVYITGRHRDFNNYYAASLYNSSGGKLEIRKKVGGSSSTLATKNYSLNTNTWYTVRLETQGTSLRMYVNDVLQLTATDSSFSSGGAGLVTLKATARYDSVLVGSGFGSGSTPTAAPTAAPTPRPTATSAPTAAPSSAPTNRTITIQAEDGVMGGGTIFESRNAGYYGTGYSNAPANGGTLTFSGISGNGTATMTIRYALASGSRTGSLRVNSSTQNITFNQTGSWTSWATMNVSIALSGSNNTMVFSSTGQDLANIDQLVITGPGVSIGSPAPTPVPTPVPTPRPTATPVPTAAPTQPPSGTGQAEVTRSGSTWTARVGGSTVYTGSRMFDAVTAACNNMGAGIVNIRNSGDSGPDGGSVYAIRPRAGQTLDFHGNTVNCNGGDLVVGIHADRRDNITVRNLVMTGRPRYGIWFRGCSNITLHNITMNMSHPGTVGLGIRVDSSTRAASNLTISGTININGTLGHGIETYGIDGINIGNVTVNNTGGCGLILNDSRNAVIGTVTGTRNNPGGGYATFRVANNNGPNIRVQKVYSRDSGRGFFSVSGSHDTIIQEVDIANNSSHGVFLEDATNTHVRSGRVVNCKPNVQLVRTTNSTVNVTH